MPELPEVETIARVLSDGKGEYQTSIIGCSIKNAQVKWARTIAIPSPEEFSERIKEQTITALTRRGKFLVFSLSRDAMLVHLRMSGDLRVEDHLDEGGEPIPLDKHDRMALALDNGLRLVFNDTRKFGRVWLVANAGEVTGDLGLEPLENSLTAEKFYKVLAARKRQIKPLLMDQSFLAGLGNIYTDEALHLARLHPLAIASELSEGDARRLLSAIRVVLKEGIRRNGASIDWVYKGGDFQNHFRAYGRTGEPCPECGTSIERMVVGQRGTHICPTCQPLA
jgi:formamidopyrimidine-DNA glycosylase